MLVDEDMPIRTTFRQERITDAIVYQWRSENPGMVEPNIRWLKRGFGERQVRRMASRHPIIRPLASKYRNTALEDS